MASGDESNGDFYAVMGLKKECSSEELRNAYKKLALRWHPDRCSASRNSEFVEEAKIKFQAIQEAYSVLSDTNKRLLYDVGVYDDDDNENGMGDFLGEMAAMMKQTKPSENKKESFEELQDLFMEMFHSDINSSFGGIPSNSSASDLPSSSSSSSSFDCFTSDFMFCNDGESSAVGNDLKRDNVDMASGRKTTASSTTFFAVETPERQFSARDQAFCFGVSDSVSSSGGSSGSRRRSGRKQKVSSRHDVSSQDAGISAS